MPRERVNLGSVKLRKLALSQTADNLDQAFSKVDDALDSLEASVASAGGAATDLTTRVEALEAGVTAVWG